MRFLADMGVDIRVVAWLRAQGHGAVHLRDQGLHRAPDAQIFATALAEDRIALTFDLDFGGLAALEQGAIVTVEETRHRVRHMPIGEGETSLDIWSRIWRRFASYSPSVMRA